MKDVAKAISSGVIYVATGQNFVDEAVHSARSVRRQSPDLRIALFTDIVVDEDCFDVVEPIQNPQYGFIDKIEAMRRSPFERTLFLDTDTIVLDPLEAIFSLLDRFDLAVAHEPARYLYKINGVPEPFAELNTGVILYQNSADFRDFNRQWHEDYMLEMERQRAEGKPTWHDQLSFTKALWDSGLSVYALPPEWNYRAPFPQFLCGRVSIFHGRMKDQTTCLAFVNKSTGGRLMNPNPGRLGVIVSSTFRLFRALKRT